MTELIQITTGGQGLPVVSARELYDYLGFDASQWSRWAKKNIINNPYAKESEDWQVLDLMSSNKKTSFQDYVLTLDFAKRLSMLARTDKGEEMRKWFVDCETQLNTLVKKNLTPEQQQIHFAQLLVKVDALERSVSQLMDREQFRLEQAQPVAFPLAVETTRAKIAQAVTRYAEITQEANYTVWNLVWNKLHIIYGFNVRAQRKTTYDNLLDVAERSGQLERIYKIVIEQFALKEE